MLTKEQQLSWNKKKKKPKFGKKKTFTKPKKTRVKKSDIIDDDYSKWLGTQPCVITGIIAERGAGANNIHCHHIYGRSRGRNDYMQVPLIGWCHSWGNKAYHNLAESDFKKIHNLEHIKDLKELFRLKALQMQELYIKNGGKIKKNVL